MPVRAIALCLSGTIAITSAACATPTDSPPPRLAQSSVTIKASAAEPLATGSSVPSAPALPPPEPSDEIVLDAVGDLMLGSTYPAGAPLPPAGGANLLVEVTPLLRAADIAFGNLEGPLFDGDLGPTCTAGGIAERNHGVKPGGTSCWSFRMPTRYGAVLRDAGFDVLSLANNHILDFGEAGRTSTIQVLQGLGVAYSGPVGTVAHLSARGKRVDVIAFATYDTSNDLTHLEAARALVARSAVTADVVVVSFHGGAEGADRQHVPAGSETFWGEDRGAVRRFAHAMVDAGADLVLGHGPHVVRGMEIRQGRLIAYSLGNFATYGAMNLTGVLGVSLILEVHVRGDGTFLEGRIHPVRQKPPGGPRLDPSTPIIAMLQSLSKDDFAETSPHISATGSISAP